MALWERFTRQCLKVKHNSLESLLEVQNTEYIGWPATSLDGCNGTS